MPADQSILPSAEDEIDLREVFAALQRHWYWVVGGGFLGLVLAVGMVSLKPSGAKLLTTALIVDTAQSPCHFIRRNLKSSPKQLPMERLCEGELETTRFRLRQIAQENLDLFSQKFNQFEYDVAPFVFDKKGREKSSTQLALRLIFPANLASEVSASLIQIKQKISELAAGDVGITGSSNRFGPSWIFIEESSGFHSRNTFSRSLILGLLGGLVVGAGSALIADRCSNRVYSREELLRRLAYPLCLGLPAGPWTSSAVRVLVGQLATQLDQSLSWRILSIAHQHQAVAPLTQLLQQQGGPALQCRSVAPLLVEVLRMESSEQPTGLLLVVEAGFNSVRALEEARLLISQMSTVHAVGVVLIGAPLPEELKKMAAG